MKIIIPIIILCTSSNFQDSTIKKRVPYPYEKQMNKICKKLAKDVLSPATYPKYKHILDSVTLYKAVPTIWELPVKSKND